MQGLKITLEDGLSCPRAYCTACKKPISKVDLAGVVWTSPRGKSGSASPRILCKDGGTGTAGYHGCLSSPLFRSLPWMELGRYVMSMFWNAGLRTPEDLRALWDSADVAARFE